MEREILGWESKVSREEGLEMTYEYFKTLPKTNWDVLQKEFIVINSLVNWLNSLIINILLFMF